MSKNTIFIAPNLEDCYVEIDEDYGFLKVEIPLDDYEVDTGAQVFLHSGEFDTSILDFAETLVFSLTVDDVEIASYTAKTQDGEDFSAKDIVENTLYQFVFGLGEADELEEEAPYVLYLVDEVTKTAFDTLSDDLSSLQASVRNLSADVGELPERTLSSNAVVSYTNAQRQTESGRLFMPVEYSGDMPFDEDSFLETTASTDGTAVLQTATSAVVSDGEIQQWRRVGSATLEFSDVSDEIPVAVSADDETLYEATLSLDVTDGTPTARLDGGDNIVGSYSCPDVYATVVISELETTSFTFSVGGVEPFSYDDGDLDMTGATYTDEAASISVSGATLEDGVLTVELSIAMRQTGAGNVEWSEWIKASAADSGTDNNGDGDGDGDGGDDTDVRMTLDNHEYRIGVLEDANRTVNSTITSIQSNISTIESNVSKVQTEANDIASDLSKAQYDIDALQTKVDKLEVGDNDFSDQLSELKETVDGFDSRITAAETTVAEAAAKVDSYDAVIANVASEVSDYGERIATAESKVAECENEVDELSSKFDSLDSNVTEMVAAVDKLQGSVDTFEPRLEACETGVANATEVVESFDSRLATVEEDQASDSASWKNLSQSFVRLDADVIAVTSRVDTLEEQVSTLETAPIDIPLFFEGDVIPSTLDYAVENDFSVRAYIPQGLTHVEFVDALVNTYAVENAVVRVTHLFEKAESSIVDSLACGEKSSGVNNRVRENGRSLIKIYLACPNPPSNLDESGEKASAFAYLRLYLG